MKKPKFKVGDTVLVRDTFHIVGWWFKSVITKVETKTLYFANGEKIERDDCFEVTRVTNIDRKVTTKKVFELRRNDERVNEFDTMDEMMDYLKDLFDNNPIADFEKFLSEFSFTESNKFVLEDA